jgi:hypothetical protein
MPVRQIYKSKMPVDKMIFGQKWVIKISVSQLPVGKISVGKMPVRQTIRNGLLSRIN